MKVKSFFDNDLEKQGITI